MAEGVGGGAVDEEADGDPGVADAEVAENGGRSLKFVSHLMERHSVSLPHTKRLRTIHRVKSVQL